jgi:hypothetical protein
MGQLVGKEGKDIGEQLRFLFVGDVFRLGHEQVLLRIRIMWFLEIRVGRQIPHTLYGNLAGRIKGLL